MNIHRKYRKVVFYKNYFEDFFTNQQQQVKRKIVWTLQFLEEVDRIPITLLKHLTGTKGLYELRVKQGSDNYRIFCFFDKGQLIIILNGFQKKTQKTPSNKIAQALKIKKEYEYEKYQNT
jgi:phage-related protein